MPVELLSTGTPGWWAAYVYRNGWVHLNDYYLGTSSACGNEAYFQIDTTSSGSNEEVGFAGSMRFGAPMFSASDMQLKTDPGSWTNWTSSIPSSRKDVSARGEFGVYRGGVEPFPINLYKRAYMGVYLDNPQPRVNEGVYAKICTTGHLQTPLEVLFDWGDGHRTTGTVNGNSSCTPQPNVYDYHAYAEAGVYEVVAEVTDGEGYFYRDSTEVTVCLDDGATACPVKTPQDPCYDAGVGCQEEDPPIAPPAEADPALNLADDASDDVSQIASETGKPTDELLRTFSPNGQVLSVTANLQQAYAGTRDCNGWNREEATREAFKDCDAAAREKRFARRVQELSLKTTGDGMGFVPDIILLQEVKKKDVESVQQYLNRNPGYGFEIAAMNSTDKNNLKDSAKIERLCRANGGNYADCLERVSLEATNAILFNAVTLDLFTKANFDTTYEIAEGRGCTGANPMKVPRVAELDENNNGTDDCEIKWMRNFTALFAEKALDENGNPTEGYTGFRVATASIHAVTGSHFVKDPDDIPEVQGGENGDDDELHEAIKLRWTKELGSHLRLSYPTADAVVIGGDFNIHRCDNKNSVDLTGDGLPDGEPLDYPVGQGCEKQDWWTAMTSPRANPESQGYSDAAYQLHRTVDDRLEPQYRDGCEVLDANGVCLDAHVRFRRIDFLFNAYKGVIAGSHDLTCGEKPTGSTVIKPTCDDLQNVHRYSDHRLVWALIGDQ